MRLKIIIFSIMSFYNFNTAMTQSGWFELPNSGVKLATGIAFADSNYGTVIGFDYIALTTNGGSTWTFNNPTGSSFNFMDLQFIDSETGYLYANQNRKFWKTTDKGNNWIQIAGTDYSHLFYFVNTLTGFLAQPTGDVKKSFDGGFNWDLLMNNYDIIPADIAFADSSNGMLIDTDGRGAVTSDGGNTWSKLFLSAGCGGKISYPEINAVYVATNNFSNTNVIRKSTNRGLTWITVFYYNSVFTDICFTDSDNGTAVGLSGLICRTTNGGESWKENYINGFYDIYGVCFLNENTGWIVNTEGRVFKTTDGGGH